MRKSRSRSRKNNRKSGMILVHHVIHWDSASLLTVGFQFSFELISQRNGTFIGAQACVTQKQTSCLDVPFFIAPKSSFSHHPFKKDKRMWFTASSIVSLRKIFRSPCTDSNF